MPVRFAHESEAHLAAFFDFYGIVWQYEPVEFVLAWDAEGRAASAFRPDFYLPEHDLFVELTTLRQDLVTRKHAKIRRLAELYPAVRVQMLHRRDYANLLLKQRLAAASAVPRVATRSA
jgi:hypoxanthine phosphoribosyltransferase